MSEMNEFSTQVLDPEIFEIVEIRLQEPNWDRAFIHYRSKKSQKELQQIALQKIEEERLRVKKEEEKQYTDEELKQMAEENAKKEVPADKLSTLNLSPVRNVPNDTDVRV